MNIYALSVLGGVMVFLWFREPDKFYLFWGLLLDVGLLFYLLYGIPGLRKRKARKMAETGGFYRIRLTEAGILPGDETVPCIFDKHSLCLESETVLTIRAKAEVVCIPKRTLTAEGYAELERIIRENGCPKKLVKTK